MTIRRYDVIGRAYAERRKPDPRIAAAIATALGAARTVLNVGAGAGSYEPTDREITAVDPSMEMIRQRPPTTATVIQASAEQLPFGDDRFDAAMAVLTVHHWQDKAAGLREVRRVTRGPVVLVTFDPSHRPWLTDYIPALAKLDDRWMPTMSDYARWLGDVTVVPLMIPMIAPTAFCTPIGAGPRRIWMSALGLAVRHFGRSGMRRPNCSGSSVILRMARGNVGTAISFRSILTMRGIGSS